MDVPISSGMVAFQGFRFDVDRRRLLHRDARGIWAPAAAGSRALDVLAVMLRQPGVLVTKDAIMDQVWPDTAVEANNLTVQIAALRKILDAGRGPESCIQTVAGRGYRFVAPVTQLPDQSATELLQRSVRSPMPPDGSAVPAQRRPSTPAAHLVEPRQTRVDSLPEARAGDALHEPRPAERRQMTVMACAVIEMAALSARLDPEDLRAVTTAWHRCCVDIIERHSGSIASYATDGLLAWFGYPRANEDDAERSVQAGLALIDAVPKLIIDHCEKLQLSIGIATGLVVVGDEATTNGSRRVTATGSTLQLAEYLHALAGAGRIVIAESTRRLIGNAFELSDPGKHRMAGSGDPIQAWRVECALVTESRFDARRSRALTPLVGREEELDLLLRRWTHARDGEGQVVLLSGEPGIGKSRIVDTLRDRLEPRGARALRFQCSPDAVNSALKPVIEHLERTLAFGRDETAETKLDRLEALIVTRHGLPLACVRLVASILSIPCDARYGPMSVTPRKHKDQTLRTLVDLATAAARRQPSVMLFEDLHWADPTTLAWLDLLVDRVRTEPILVVLTHRPEFQARWSQGHVVALNLSKLTRGQSAAMIASLLGNKALPAILLEQILTRTDGVPLFVEELTKSILESGELKASGNHFEYAGPVHTITIPGTLRDSLTARLDRLAAAREIAQIGAAIGREFGYELIAAVASMPQARLDASLQQLTESGLVFRRGTAPDAVYTFKHALVQDAAYGTLLRSQRQRLHARIVSILEDGFSEIVAEQPALLAQHCVNAGLAEKAVIYWLRAGQQALARPSMIEAAAYSRRGLDALRDLPDSQRRGQRELDLQSTIAKALLWTRASAATETEKSVVRATNLAEQLDQSKYLVVSILSKLSVHLMRGEHRRALALGQEVEKDPRLQNDTMTKFAGSFMQGISSLFLGEFVAARAFLQRAIDAAGQAREIPRGGMGPFDLNLDNGPLLSHLYATSLVLLAKTLAYLGYIDQAQSRMDEALSEARRLGQVVTVVHVLLFATSVDELIHSPLVHLEELLVLSTEHGMHYHSIWARILRGRVWLAAGRTQEGLAALEQELAELRSSGAMASTPWLLASLAEANSMLGQPAEAASCLAESAQIIETTDERIFEADLLHRLHGDLLVAAGGRSGAERSYRQAIAVAERQSAKLYQLRSSVSLARLWRDMGRAAEAHDLLAPIYGWFTEGLDAPDLLEAKALLAELCRER